MRRLSAVLVIGVVCVGVLAGCGRQTYRQDTVQVKFWQPEGGKVSILEPAKGGWTPPLTSTRCRPGTNFFMMRT